jgi:hypothetical protein
LACYVHHTPVRLSGTGPTNKTAGKAAGQHTSKSRTGSPLNGGAFGRGHTWIALRDAGDTMTGAIDRRYHVTNKIILANAIFVRHRPRVMVLCVIDACWPFFVSRR